MGLCKYLITFAQKFKFCAVETLPNFIEYIEQAIRDNWHKDSLTDYKGSTLQYHDVARKIEKLHIMFDNAGVKPGDKIALCGRNSSMWAAAFLAVLTYGAVAVPIQHEFTSEQVYNIVNHSDARLLFVGDVVATQLDYSAMPGLEGVIFLPDLSLVMSRSDGLSYAREHLNELYGRKYPKSFRADDIHYYNAQPDELALINYTSGTTGYSKGVMLTYRSLSSNLEWTLGALGGKIARNSHALSILPMAHMYGLMIEFLFQFAYGNHIFFLTRLPSPTVIAEALAVVKPSVVVSVPLVVEKIVRKKIFPQVQTLPVHMLMNMPVIKKKVNERIKEMVRETFGGNLYEIIVGGAGLNPEIEQFLKGIDFPITTGYGTTETGPMISYSDYHDFRLGSCGTVVSRMEVKVASPDPATTPGEILTRGDNLMTGYYKNEEATRAVIDEDGWFHTGDLATMDSDGYLYIRGRIKNMILGANGQNVYPEEIESKLNNMPMVSESLVVQRGNKIVGLVHPDFDEAHELGLSRDDLSGIMEQNRNQLNAQLPAFCKISSIHLQDKEFEKTPKKSIKRYLYQMEEQQ